MRWTTFLESPARGGSTTSTSGRPARASSSGSARRVSPAKKWALVTSLRRARGDRVGDRLLDQLDPPQLARARGERQRDRADAAVEVVHALPALQRGVLGDDAVQQLGHLGVRLKERLRGDPQIELAQALGQLGLAPHELGLAAGGGLGEAARARPQDAAESARRARAERQRERAGIELAVGGDEAHLQLARCAGLRARRGCAARAPVRGGPRAAGRRPTALAATLGGPPVASAASRASVATPPLRRAPTRQALLATPAQRDLARAVAELGGEQAVVDRRHAVAARRRRESRTAARRCAGPSPNEYSSLLR